MAKAKKIFIFLLSAVLPVVVSADGIPLTNPIKYNELPPLLEAIADGIGTIIIAAAVLMIVFSAILFVISGGSPDKLGNAKKSFMYAIVGLVIGILAKTIVAVVKYVVGAN